MLWLAQRELIADKKIHYPHINRIQITQKIQLLVPKTIVELSGKFAQNLLSNGWISDWVDSIVIWIATKS